MLWRYMINTIQRIKSSVQIGGYVCILLAGQAGSECGAHEPL